MQHVGQHVHVPAGHDHGGRSGDHGGDDRAVLGDDRPVVRRHPVEELAAHAVDVPQVRLVQLADRGDGLG